MMELKLSIEINLRVCCDFVIRRAGGEMIGILIIIITTINVTY